MRRSWRELAVPFHENQADVGFRLEAPNDLFDPSFFYQTDPKYKFRHGSMGSSRTFCSCKDGLIVPVQFGTAFYADGAFANTATGRTNVTFMVRSNADTSLTSIEDWCAGLNARGCGSLLLATLNLASQTRLSHQIMGTIGSWPSAQHEHLMQMLLEKVVDGGAARVFRRGAEGKVKVFGPAVDLYWPLPVLTPELRTPRPGISIIGDATGMSRGILQSMVSGAAWGFMEGAKLSLSHGMQAQR